MVPSPRGPPSETSKDDHASRVAADFRKFDTNGDGTIDRADLVAVLRKLSGGKDQWSNDQIELLMSTMDTNGDGKISYDEFVQWVFQTKANNAPKEQPCRSQQGFAPLDKRGSFSIDYRTLLPERFDIDITERYALDKQQIGEGGYGKVFIAKDKEYKDRKVAVKKVTKNAEPSANNEALMNEIATMKVLDHPNICKLLATFERGRSMFFIMELCEGGEVFDRIVESGQISESIAADIIAQVTSALGYAHSFGIAHRDIKPENVVFCTTDPHDTSIKLIDWGLAMSFVGTPMKSAVGSFTYAAPEVIMSRELKSYTEKCDLWSLGVLTYVMLCGKPPFWGSQREHIKKALAEKYPMTAAPWDKMNPHAKNFVQRLIKANPENRMPIDQAAAHPWLVTRQAQASTSETVEILKNLRHFGSISTFTRMCIAAVAKQLDHKQLKDIHLVFRQMDTSGDGVLTLDEVSAGFKKIFGEDSTEFKQVGDMFGSLDLDGSGAIDYTEFCAAGLGQKLSMQEDVLFAAFKTFDLDNTGYISIADLQHVLDEADVRDAWTADVCKVVGEEIVEYADHDGDGRINFEDWKKMMERSWDKHHQCDEASKKPEAHLDHETYVKGIDPYQLLLQVSNLPPPQPEAPAP